MGVDIGFRERSAGELCTDLGCKLMNLVTEVIGGVLPDMRSAGSRALYKTLVEGNASDLVDILCCYMCLLHGQENVVFMMTFFASVTGHIFDSSEERHLHFF